MTYEQLIFDKRKGVAWITLNRPKQFNALDVLSAKELLSAAQNCDTDTSVRAVVIMGAGERAFCSGGDVGAFASNPEKVGDLIEEMTGYLHEAISKFARMRVPVIAAVNGIAAGAGLGLVAAADIVIATESAKFTSAYTKIGLTPDGSSTYFLSRILGRRRTMELFLTNRLLSAEEAMNWGLVNQVHRADQFLSEVESLAASFAQGPTLAYANLKRLVLSAHDEELETQMNLEANSIVSMARTVDGLAGVMAFKNKTDAIFTGT